MNSVSADFRDMPEPVWLDAAAAFAVKAIDAIGEDFWDLSLYFCGDAFMANLNAEYRGKNGSTDVLSFTLGEWVDGGNGRRYIAGDVVVCLPVLEHNALEFGVSQEDELKRLIMHGVLHLAGLDHATNSPDEPMLVRQESLLLRLSEEKIF